MKMILSEKQILTTIRLSGVQKAILAKIVAAQTPELAYEQISDGRNFVATRDILQKLRLIEFTEGTASITEEGKKVMRDENLMDESGELTSEGQQYVEPKNANEIDTPTSGQADDDASTQPGEDEFGLGDEMGGDAGGDLDLSTDDMGGDPNGEDLLPDDQDPAKKKQFESLLSQVNSNRQKITESVESTTFTLREVGQMEAGNDLSDNLLNKIQEFVVEHDPTWMPTHVQKARLSDPHNWIMDHLGQIITTINKTTSK